MRVFIVLLLMFTVPGWCDGWSHHDNTWKHPNGLSITFPPDFQVETATGDILNVTGKQGFISYTVQGMKGEKLFKSWLLGEQQSFEKAGLETKSDSTRKLKNGITGRFIETERMSEQGILFVIVSTALSKGQDYLCLQMRYPKEREKDWSPLLQSTVNSCTGSSDTTKRRSP